VSISIPYDKTLTNRGFQHSFSLVGFQTEAVETAMPFYENQRRPNEFAYRIFIKHWASFKGLAKVAARPRARGVLFPIPCPI
jgi:hypothetical protein